MTPSLRRTPPLSRRAVLRGTGATLGLPFLGAMARAGSTPTPPRRLLFVYVPNGVHVEAWRRPAGVPDAAGIARTLDGLGELATEVTHLRGLTCDKARSNGDGAGDHARASGAWLTCAQPLKAEGAVQAGVSVDQVAAQHASGATPFRGLAVGGEPPRTAGQCDSGYSCAYSSHLSWVDAQRPLAKETDPVRLFDRLFRGGADLATAADRSRRAHRRRSVLDLVRADAADLRRTLGTEDRAGLDRYLDSVRELERRVALVQQERVEAVPDSARPADVPSDHFAHLRLLADLVALALATDRTRVVTLQLANEGSNRSFPELGVTEGHHTLSHHGDDPLKLEAIARIDRAYLGVFKHLLERLGSAGEGEGSLLDHCAALYGSGIADGNRHDHDDLPLLLAGRMGGVLHPGRTLEFPAETPLANLHLTLLHGMGLPVGSFADASGTLDTL